MTSLIKVAGARGAPSKRLPGSRRIVLLAVGSLVWAWGQAAEPVSTASGVAQLAPVVVTGTRASLASAQQVKRSSLEIVDAVLADDIMKLPDFSVTDALQRITGVQIARDRGDGTATVIRGLTQMQTTLNGREVFSAGTGRNLEFADISAEMLAGVRVYKTSSAPQIEGGIGGLVDLRTRRPFDFTGREIAVSLRRVDSRLAQAGANQFSLLASDRWQTTAAGEFGVLVNVSRQDRAWREDQKSSGNPVARSDIVPGRVVNVASSTSETTSVGQRQRTGIATVLQWRPNEQLDLYAEAAYAQLDTRQDSYQINVSAAPTFQAGSAQLFAGTDDVQRITWTNAPISILSFARDTTDRTRSAALGGSWSDDALTVKVDLSHAQSFSNLFFSGPVLGGTAATFTQDVSTSAPFTRVGGTDLLDPHNFQVSSLSYRTRPFAGRLSAGRIDLEQRLQGGFLQAIEAGLRYARRGATDAPGLVFADASVSGVSAADPPGFAMPNPYGDFLGTGAAANLANYIVGNPDPARDAVAYRRAFGITTPIPSGGSPLGLWTIREDTQAAYVATRFQAAGFPLDGNAGLRVVRTREDVDGNQSLPVIGGTAPIAIASSYVDVLPSVNLRYRLAPEWQVRAAASKTVTRPNFDQLSPSVTLIRNSVDPTLNQGTAGNPGLAPVRSRNLDLALEAYLGETTSAHVTGFVKRVEGFVTTVSSPETYDGVTYQVSRPQSGPTADIRGVEFGYQQFFGFLPGAWRGLGLQANYTYVDSEMNSPGASASLPLQNFSRNSYNLIGLYELGPVSARVAYNWRSRFLSGITNVVGLGSLPVYTRGYGWLDASLRLKVNPRLTLALEGNNLLNTRRTSYYGEATRPQSAWINDVQIGVGATLRF